MTNLVAGATKKSNQILNFVIFGCYQKKHSRDFLNLYHDDQ